MERKPETPAAPSLTDRVLDAAEAVVVRQGIGSLTLDAVAAEAGISKGGLLHHFASKDRLIEAMVLRCARGWRECVIGAYEDAAPGRGRMARAMLGHLADAKEWTDQCQQSSSAVFAALVQNPRLIEPMRGVYSELRQRLSEDGLAPGVGETVVAAMDGLWLCRVLGLATVDQGLMDRIRLTLEPLLGRSAPDAAPVGEGVSAGQPGVSR
jgi:AcrR family transcriptional regulator